LEGLYSRGTELDVPLLFWSGDLHAIIGSQEEPSTDTSRVLARLDSLHADP
jgi:hypothetical protein